MKYFLQNRDLFLLLQSQKGIGEMAEWSNAAVLKTVDLKGFGGSNPSLSAENRPDDENHPVFLCEKSSQSLL